MNESKGSEVGGTPTEEVSTDVMSLGGGGGGGGAGQAVQPVWLARKRASAPPSPTQKQPRLAGGMGGEGGE